MAEHFRDEGRDVLLFIDNIYRYTLAGTEVSALLGRMPSAVGYQPTLADENGGPAGTHYLHQDRLHYLLSGHLRSRRRPDRSLAGRRRLPTLMPRWSCPARLRSWESTLRWIPWTPPPGCSTPLVIGNEHYDTARSVQGTLQRYKELQDIIAILGDGRVVRR